MFKKITVITAAMCIALAMNGCATYESDTTTPDYGVSTSKVELENGGNVQCVTYTLSAGVAVDCIEASYEAPAAQ